ncbi:MAG TPA: FAD-linked oxidase C-terminal domain-containing protein, partial [Acidimicrobiales bacterium]|nr:FAD-linked oxidase C-terminal domain-containing protein [Acidimicrobiales bacterium]
VGAAVPVDYTHDEALTSVPATPLAVVRPRTSAEVAALLRLCDARRVPVVARGSGTGLSGAAVPPADGVLVSFERMNEIIELDTANHVAVVEPGVTLGQLDAALEPLGLVYPVFPGELSASLGGNVATNAGGMRAIKYGVTRNHVLGLEAVLPSGEVIRTGGKYVKTSTGYDLTQLLVGSEGTLALVTEATLKLWPRPAHAATLLAPFPSLEEVTAAVPRIVHEGVGPRILEYVDALTMAAITGNVDLDLGIPDDVKDRASAYLVAVLEGGDADRLDEDVAAAGVLLEELGAVDVYVLPAHAGAELISAREKAFFVAKAAGADDIIDVVVPRAAIPQYMAKVGSIADEFGALVTGCGHVGDGNIHLSVFQPDESRRAGLMRAIYQQGIELGGAVSAEHGIGTAKLDHFLALEDPAKVALMRRIKAAFDPNGILNPGKVLG